MTAINEGIDMLTEAVQTANSLKLAQPQEPVAWGVFYEDELQTTEIGEGAEERARAEVLRRNCIDPQVTERRSVKPLQIAETQGNPLQFASQPTPPECQTEAEKIAFAFGWFKALEAQCALDKKAENARELGLNHDY